MGRLAGYRYRDVVRRLRGFGFAFDRQAAGAATRSGIMRRPIIIQYTTVPNHPGEMPEGTFRAILREAHIDVNEFVNLK